MISGCQEPPITQPTVSEGTGQNYKPCLSGTITYPDGTPAAGIKITSDREKKVTDASGKFNLTNILAGGDPAPSTLMVTFEKEGYGTVTKIFDTLSLQCIKTFNLALEPALPGTTAQRICGKINGLENYTGHYKFDLCDVSKGHGFEISLSLDKALRDKVSAFDSGFVSITDPELSSLPIVIGFGSIRQIDDCKACDYPSVPQKN